MGIADFFNQPDWSQRAGTGLQAFGAGLSGRDPNVPIQRYQQGIERDERKANIAALMGNMGIGGNQRALLDMMPQEAQMQSLYDIQGQNRAAAATEAANAAFMQSIGMGAPQGITETTLPATYSEGLAGTESGGDYGVVNAEGFGGKYQFGQPRLTDYNRATGQNVTMDQFLQSPQIQEAAQAWNVGDTDNYISKNSLDQYIGQNVGGVTMTQDGLRAMAHLGGNSGMRKFLESGGQYNPADSNGTRLSDYAQTHAGGIGSQQPQMGGDQSLGGDPTLLNWMRMANDPKLGAGQKQYLEMMIADRMGDEGTSTMQNYTKYAQQTTAAGEQPMSFIDYQNAVKAGTNITVNTGPTGVDYGDPDAGFAWARDANKEIITEADPETGYMRPVQVPFGGGKAEAAITELERRDVAAAEETQTALRQTEADAGSMLKTIDSIMNNPDLHKVLGPIEGQRESFFTQKAADAFAATQNLSGKVFMEAYEGLKGGGTITEIEGLKAESAIARLQRTQSPESYLAALQDLRDVVVANLERAGGSLEGEGAADPRTKLRTYNPETRKLE